MGRGEGVHIVELGMGICMGRWDCEREWRSSEVIRGVDDEYWDVEISGEDGLISPTHVMYITHCRPLGNYSLGDH
jgi:hypothetical protein